MDKYFYTLELHKILEMLEKECSNPTSKQMAISIEPLKDIYLIKKEIGKTSCAFDLTVRYGLPVFVDFPDISKSIKRADSGAALSLKELLDIAKILYQTRMIVNWRNQFSDANDTELDYLFEQLFTNKTLEDRITSSIINDEEVSDSASPELASIRRKIVQAGSKIRDTLEKMIKSSTTQKYLQESLVTIRDGRYVLPVKSEHKNEISGLVHDTSSTGSTLFIEPMSVVEANNDIRVLKGKEQDEIQRIIYELSSMCAEFSDALLSNFRACCELNLYFAKSRLGSKMRGTVPEIADDGEIILKKARHPLIDTKVVVPIDFSIGNNYDALIITGPNTGGKTVILKTVGLLTAMTMCGLMIPASDGSKISIFDNILADIGDQQSIEQNLSTFSAHMKSVIEILNACNDKSLVLLDELGSGTDPVEGAALAISIIEDMKNKGAKIVTTTHYQELKMYAIETDGVENASCEFNVETLQPTYRLIIGSPGKSNAFEISKTLGLPDDVITSAKALVSDENKKFEHIIEALERTRHELEENVREAHISRREAEKLSEELKNERESFDVERNEIFEKAQKEAIYIVEKVTRESNRMIDELVELRKEKDKKEFSERVAGVKSSNKRSIDELYKDVQKLNTKNNTEYKLPRALKVGDLVLTTDTNKKGTVVTLPDSNDMCFVQIGIMKMKIQVSKLRLLENEKITFNNGKVSTKGVESRMTRAVKTELDIRGYAVDDGLYEIDSFLDNAVMSGLSTATIIHGKGTGVLKNAVRAYLKRHPHVASSRKGVYGEGEDGVTVVELK